MAEEDNVTGQNNFHIGQKVVCIRVDNLIHPGKPSDVAKHLKLNSIYTIRNILEFISNDDEIHINLLLNEIRRPMEDMKKKRRNPGHTELSFRSERFRPLINTEEFMEEGIDIEKLREEEAELDAEFKKQKSTERVREKEEVE